MQEIKHQANPFPGLRPFESSETHLFFGRDGQSEELLRRLKRTRFLAVVGTSGSGKSSLVRAGLLPALQGGLLANAGSDWRIAILRPGSDPIGNLARALSSPAVLGSRDDERSAVMQAVLAETTLRRSSLGLVELVHRARTKLDDQAQSLFPDYENLLIVVDQFEELFRFKQLIEEETTKEDAAAFVKLLLEAVKQREEKIYVVLTMRSDFLGDCSQFWELPEAINNGQYLIPRMTRDERREAIAGPVAVGEGAMTEPLVNQLLNDVGDSPDQLPILQHALMRTWDYWLNNRRNGEPIDIPDYNAIGGMTEALSRHADEAYEELNGAQKVIAEKMFKGLTEKGTDNREIRRPMEVREICELTGANEAAVIAVIEVFRRKGRSFLMPPPTDALTGAPIPLNKESLIDISHESLIRNWERLRKWVEEESRSVRLYLRLAETAVLHREGGAGLWHDPDLQITLDWREQNKPNRVWGRRYHPEFALAMSFLDESIKARAAQIAREEARLRKERNSARRAILILALLFSVSAVLGIIAYRAKVKAEEHRLTAEQEVGKNKHLFYTLDINLLGQAYEVNNFARGVELLEAHSPSETDDEPGYEWYYLWHLYHKEQATLKGHTSNVYSLAFSPDGKTLASASRDGTAKLWDTASRQELASLNEHTDSVTSVDFSPDGKMLATASWDNTVKLWSMETRQEVATLKGHEGAVFSVAFSPDGKMLASGSADKTVKLWDVESHQEVAMLKGHKGGIASLTFSHDGKTLATGSDDSTVRLWNVKSHRELVMLGKPSEHEVAVFSLAFSLDGKTIAAGATDNTVKLWDTRSHQEITTLRGHSGYITSVIFSPDGKLLATASADTTVKLWDTKSYSAVTTLSGHIDTVHSVVFSPDGKMLATGSADNTVKLWDAAPRQELTTLGGDESGVTSIAFSPDGKMLATSSADTTANLWDAASGQEVATLSGHTAPVLFVAFSPDGKMLATASMDKTVKLWSVETHQEVATLKGHEDTIFSVAFSPDGKMLATGSLDKTAKLWDTTTYQEIATLRSHTEGVRFVVFSRDSKMLATGSGDHMAMLWDTATRQEVATLKGHESDIASIAFSPDGKTLATASLDRTVKLWDTNTHQEIATLKGHLGAVLSVTFFRDGKTLATGSADNTAKLWDIASYHELTTLKGHEGMIVSVIFSPVGRTLATASFGKNVRLWHGATDEEVAAQRK